MKRTRPVIILYCILLAKALLMLALILSCEIGLAPDEAQYWCWSQNLDWGYYSKAPGIAWQIKLSTYLLGNTELGVRLLALVVAFFLPLAVFRLAKNAGLQEKTAVFAALGMALCPVGFLSSLFATTDGAFILFWTLACAEAAQSIAKNLPPRYLLIGFYICLAALFKWTALLLWPGIFLAMLAFPTLRQSYVWKGVAVTLLALIPSLIWNVDHEWATFRHVGGQIVGSPDAAGKANPVDFFLAQAALFSPILFLFFLSAFYLLLRDFKGVPAAVRFCGLLSLGVLLPMASMSFFQKMQGNWAVCAFPTLLPFAAWYAYESASLPMHIRKIALPTAVLCSLLLLAVPLLQNRSLPIPYSFNLFRQNIGWNTLSSHLQQLGYRPEQHFLFSDHYQMTSILNFYGPKQHKAYFLNLRQRRNNQFTYWPGLAQEKLHQTGFFVLTENSPALDQNPQERVDLYTQILQNYFENVRYEGTFPLVACKEKELKASLVFRCENYNGTEPKRVTTY